MSKPARERKLQRKMESANFGTWNVRGNTDSVAKLEVISSDLRKRKISVCALQETFNSRVGDVRLENGDLFIFFGRQANQRGGLAFYIHAEWAHAVGSSRGVSERISVLRFSFDTQVVLRGQSAPPHNFKHLVLINAYGHTMHNGTPEMVRGFFHELETVYRDERRGSDLIFVMGDFNAKIGGRISEEDANFMGLYGKGVRNANGEELRDFLESTSLYLANTHFNHRPMQIATWHGGRPSAAAERREDNYRRQQPGLHNQLDYIAVPKRMLPLFTDARAFLPHNQAHRTDHSLLVAKVRIHSIYRLKKLTGARKVKREYSALAEDLETRGEFQEVVSGYIGQLREEEATSEQSPAQKYEKIKKILNRAAEETLPEAPIKVSGYVQYSSDTILSNLSEQQRRLSARIFHKTSKRNARKVEKLKRRRNRIFQAIKQRRKVLARQHMENLAEGLEGSSSTREAHEFARILKKNTTQRLIIIDADGSEIRKPRLQLREVTRFYEGFYRREGEEPLPEWIGEARELLVEVTMEEVASAAAELRNRRATGPDKLVSELLKYGGEDLHRELAELINQIFREHSSIEELKAGILFPLNKLKGDKVPANTRPVVFLVALRKILSTIVLRRIEAAVGVFLSINQHAYRRGRSTTEAVWTWQWVRGMTERYSERMRFLGLDLSKAFDSLDRSKLMDILRQYNLATEDELRIIQFLLSKTTLRGKINGELGKFFATHIGTPQGDALSPILFLIYLEHVWRTFAGRTLLKAPDVEVTYADDVNLALRETKQERDGRVPHEPFDECACADCRCSRVVEGIDLHFAEHHLKLNLDKTVLGEITPRVCNVGGVILGISLNAKEELKRRKSRAATAFNQLYNLWLRNMPVAVSTKMKIYTSTVLPHFLHSAAAVVFRKVEGDKINSLHRAQLRRLLGVHFPAHVSNKDVYAMTNSLPITVEMVRARWSFLGHLLRRAQATPSLPAFKSMLSYFYCRLAADEPLREQTHRGRLLTTTPRLLAEDLELIEDRRERMRLFGIEALDSSRSVFTLRNKAGNRVKWREAVKILVERAYEKWKEVDAIESLLRAERNAAAVIRRQEIVEGVGAPARGRGRPRGSRGRGRGPGRGPGRGDGEGGGARGGGRPRGRPRGSLNRRGGRGRNGQEGAAGRGAEAQQERGRARGRPRGVRGGRRAQG